MLRLDRANSLPDLGDQLLRLEGFGDIVDDPCLLAFYGIVNIIPAHHEDNGYLRERRRLLEPGGEGIAVYLRQINVGEHDIRSGAGRFIQGGLSVAHAHYFVVAAGKQHFHDLLDGDAFVS